MFRLLSGVLLFLFWSQIGAAILWINPKVHVTGGFIKLSQLVVKPEGDRYENIFLGQISTGDVRKIELSYIHKRLKRFGYLTLTPKSKNGHDFVFVEAISKDTHKALEPKGQISKNNDMMVVLKEALPRGTILRAEMLELVPFIENNEHVFRTLKEVIGHELERNLSKGSSINPRYISRPPLVRRGDMVKVIIRTPGIEISGIGKALEDGNLGETIGIRRKHESIQAKILDDQTVIVQGP